MKMEEKACGYAFDAPAWVKKWNGLLNIFCGTVLGAGLFRGEMQIHMYQKLLKTSAAFSHDLTTSI